VDGAKKKRKQPVVNLTKKKQKKVVDLSGSSSSGSSSSSSGRSSSRIKTLFKDKLNGESVKTLKWMLRRNKQKLGGSKEDLIERILDRQKNGCIPLCPKIPKGYTSATLKPIGDGTTFTCSGHYKNGKRVGCKFKEKLRREAFDCQIIQMQNDDCPICLEKIPRNKVTTACGHSFHLECLNTHKKYKKTCPLCRQQL
jgi:hypothetical protein